MPSRLVFRRRPEPLGPSTVRAGNPQLEGELTQVLGIDGAPLRGPSGRIRSQLTMASGGGPSYPNLPGGYSILTDRDFLAKVENGWTDRGDAAFEIVTPATDAMASLSNRLTTSTGRARFSVGLTGGNGPILTEYSIPSASRRVGLYTVMNWAVSAPWVGHPAGVNKILFCVAGSSASGPVYYSAQGVGAGSLAFQVRTQATPAGARNLTPNVGNGTLVRGVRYRIAVWLVLNSCQADGTANADGSCQVWIDGTLTHSYADVVYRGNGSTGNTIPATALWTGVKWNPTWGGGATDQNGNPITLSTLQYQYMYDLAVGTGV